MEPLDAEQEVASTTTQVSANSVPCVIGTTTVTEALAASLTVMVYEPGHKPVTTAVLCPLLHA